MYICKYCGKKIDSPSKLGGHIYHCKMGPYYEKAHKISLEAISKANEHRVDDGTKIFKCKYCGKEYTSRVKLGGHVTHCKLNPNYENSLMQLSNARQNTYKNIKRIISNENCECEFCKKQFSIYGIKQHIVACKENPNALPKEKRGNKGKTLGSIPWNKGLTKETDERLKKAGETYKSHILDGTIKSTGGYREYAEKSYRYGWYNGIFCNSSWELAYVIYCQEHDIKIERNTTYLTYIDNDNIERKFYPDFLIDDTLLVEIKGMQDPNYINKQKFNPNIKFIFKDDMKEILKYVKEKHGKDFIKLYNANLN